MHDLRMELRCIDLPLWTFHRCHRADRRMSGHTKSFRRLCNIVRMTHPCHRGRFHIFEKNRRPFHLYVCMPVLTDRSRLYSSAQTVCNQLRTVTDSQNRNARLKYFFLIMRRSFIINAVRPACEDNPFRIHLLYLLKAQRVRMHLTIYIAFSDSARNQLIILSAKVQNDDHFFSQTVFPPRYI